MGKITILLILLTLLLVGLVIYEINWMHSIQSYWQYHVSKGDIYDCNQFTGVCQWLQTRPINFP